MIPTTKQDLLFKYKIGNKSIVGRADDYLNKFDLMVDIGLFVPQGKIKTPQGDAIRFYATHAFQIKIGDNTRNSQAYQSRTWHYWRKPSWNQVARKMFDSGIIEDVYVT